MRAALADMSNTTRSSEMSEGRQTNRLYRPIYAGIGSGHQRRGLNDLVVPLDLVAVAARFTADMQGGSDG